MVGRRGISKGCMRCRQRKKGCDLQRPACGQCLQRGSTCPGYGAGVTFVHDSRSPVSGRTAPLGNQNHGLSAASTPASLARSATLFGLSDHFWYLYMPRKYASHGSQNGGLGEFFQAVEHIRSDEVISKHAFWALSSLIIGRQVSDSQLLLQGSRMYGQALKELRSAVQKVRNVSSEPSAEMAMTCNLLALYELFDKRPETNSGFFTHSQGLAELVKLRGPHGFRSDPAWAAFQGVRAAIIFSAVQRREGTFISSKEWCTIPWELHDKPPWHRVMDIMAQVPELLENFDKLQAITSYEEWQVWKIELLEYCWILHRVLQTWYEDLPSSFGLEASAELWSSKESSQTHSPFTIEIDFEDQIHGQALILYWATCVLVYSTMQRIYQSPNCTAAFEVKPVLSSGDSHLSLQTDPYYYAARIVQSTPYFLQSSVGLLMRKIFSFPLATAYAYFASFPNRSFPALLSNTPSSSALKFTGTSGFDYLASADKLTSTSKAADIGSEFIKSYLEITAKTMNIKGLKIDILCGPSIPDYRLSFKQSG